MQDDNFFKPEESRALREKKLRNRAKKTIKIIKDAPGK